MRAAIGNLPMTDFRDQGSAFSVEWLSMEKQNNMYFTIWYGVHKTQHRRTALRKCWAPAIGFVQNWRRRDADAQRRGSRSGRYPADLSGKLVKSAATSFLLSASTFEVEVAPGKCAFANFVKQLSVKRKNPGVARWVRGINGPGRC
jgi:hypothetical protein